MELSRLFPAGVGDIRHTAGFGGMSFFATGTFFREVDNF